MIERVELTTVRDALDLVRSCTVPSRAITGVAARKSHHREDWCIARFVLRQLEAGIYSLPIIIERQKPDPPDFLLSIAGAPAIAVEVRDAGEEALQKATTALSRAPQGTWLEEGRLVPPGGKLTGRGTTGDEPERRWAREVRAAIEAKTADLPRHSHPAARFELLLYDQTHTGANPVRGAVLVGKVAPAQGPTGPLAFDRVSVLSDARLLLDVYGERRLLELSRGEEP